MENKEVHYVLLITFEELLLNFVSYINQHTNRKEIYKIMNTEILSAECKCFSGRIGRLVSCLDGFDPNIKINISPSEQISNIILQEKKKMKIYDVVTHKQIVRDRLVELGYDIGTIQTWIDFIE